MNITIPKDYIAELDTALERNKKAEIATLLKRIQAGDNSNMKDYLLTDLISRVKYNQKNLFNENLPLGINNSGYAGIGLNLILKDI